MATPSLKPPDKLKQRAINAVEQTVCAAEQRAGFIAEALAAEQEMLESGEGYAADDVHRYIKARLAGENPERPEAKPWRH